MNSSPVLACASPSSRFEQHHAALKRRLLTLFCFLVAWMIVSCLPADAAELTNGLFRIELGVDSSGLPVIKQGVWTATNQQAFVNEDALDLSDWLPDALIPPDGIKIKSDPWRVTQNDGFIVGEACGSLAGGLKITWVVELASHAILFRVHVRLANKGEMSQEVEWFPAWAGTWQVPDGADSVRWWKALSLDRLEDQFPGKIKLGSRVESSSTHTYEDAVNPFWIVSGKSEQFYFGVEWCGGWSAKLRDATGGFSFTVNLTSSDTQLVLNPGEVVDGPALFIMPATAADYSSNRRSWISRGQFLANTIYQGPQPSFPLTYNHWYAIGWDVDAAFLRRQMDSMDPYGFDAFIVDAGWFDSVGSWEPDPSKFQPGEFEAMMASISQSGVKVGIWSCPQFVTAKPKRLPPEIEQPPYYRDSLGGYLLDLAGSGFTDRVTSHVAKLRERYSADWWKYDQTFFTEESRAGAMKNVLAFQAALLAVRAQHPDLVIENCERGGRMINALTTMATQTTWLLDGDSYGLPHAQQNIQLALGALDFMSPWSVYRWTNNLDKMDPLDDELTRFYCRSAMAGTWGISADLSKISDHQQSVIVQEIQNYRRLNPIKLAGLYELLEPTDGAPAAGVTFYDARRKKAAVMLYRWDGKQGFTQQIAIDKLRTTSSYLVTDVDTGASTTVSGDDLLRDGLAVQFGPNRMSALLFIEAAN